MKVLEGSDGTCASGRAVKEGMALISLDTGVESDDATVTEASVDEVLGDSQAQRWNEYGGLEPRVERVKRHRCGWEDGARRWTRRRLL